MNHTTRIHPRTLQVRGRRAALITKAMIDGKWCGHWGGLQFDCIKPTGHWHHVTGSEARVRYYEQQYALGNLQLLCKDCHQAKSRAEHYARTHLQP